MAVHVHKDGKSELIDPLMLQSALQSGWSVDPNGESKNDEPKKRKRRTKAEIEADEATQETDDEAEETAD